MSDFHTVDPKGWEYDLQSVYSAYMGYFQLHSIPWHDRAWGHFFETFEQFLSFSWPVVIVTDARTGRAHIVTRMTSITSFLKMIKTRSGETLPQVEHMLRVTPAETSQRYLRHVNDWPTYKKLHSSLPAVAAAAFKARVRVGEPSAIRELWASRDKTFLAIDFEGLEKNDRLCIEWGYAAIRSGLLEAAGAWPPVPETNYRYAFFLGDALMARYQALSQSSKGHYIVYEYADMLNKASPSLPWQYAFGESQVIAKAKMPVIIQSVLSLMTPDSETAANNVVLVCHGVQAVMERLDEMKIKLPNNMLIVDIAYLERTLYNTGQRGQMHDRKTGRVRLPESLLGLGSLLHSFGIEPPCVLHNAGNDAFMTLVAFQRMVDPRGGAGVGTNAVRAMVNGVGKKTSGNGHPRRADTVPARFFRPLGSVLPEPGKNGPTGNGKENGNGSRDLSQTRAGRQSGEGADEMGMFVNMKRASMFNTLTSPLMVPVDQNKKRSSKEGGVSGSGQWLSVAGQRRQSVMRW